VKRVAIYVRVSTVEQAEKGWSVEGQYREIREFCERHEGWKVARVFEDRGYSAADLKRPGIQRLLDQVQEGRVDILAVWKSDRLSRDNIDFPVLLHILERHGVRVVSVCEPSLDRASPYGEFVVGMLGLIATLERMVLQTRVKMGLRERSRRGLWHGGMPPFGYTYDGSTGKLAQRPEEVAVLRDAFKLYLAYGCLYATRDALNARGHATRSGKEWSVPELRRVLRRETYRGVLRSSGIEVRDAALVVVNADTFAAAQGLLDAEKPTPTGDRRRMKHQFGGKGDYPPCPECRNAHAVRRRGTRLLAGGARVQLFYCNICERTFDRETSHIPLPSCPRCAANRAVQYFRERTSLSGVRFRVFRCRGCNNRFRILLPRERLHA
jgi:DNA invertase Pin-like site-specific DNA recombinase/transposase-like protein